MSQHGQKKFKLSLSIQYSSSMKVFHSFADKMNNAHYVAEFCLSESLPHRTAIPIMFSVKEIRWNVQQNFLLNFGIRLLS
jgi:hypothetical protein